MPCRADERFAQGPEPPKATTRTRLARNGGASRKEPEVEDPVENETEEVDAIDGDEEADEESDDNVGHS
jgi:hypothetical protein